MISDQSEPHAVTTIRDLIDGLTELAGMLPEGFETRVELGVCDGEDLQLIEKVDLGLSPRTAKFVKKYADLSAVLSEAATAFAEDVTSGTFPDEEHSYR